VLADTSAQLTVLIALGVLIVIMRWVFSGKKRHRARPVDASDSRELGLLQVVATKLSRDGAMRARARLGESDIRSSMSRRSDGSYDVLVFSADVDRARPLL
jgi:hypothetical protein